jgi:hypothetical protein
MTTDGLAPRVLATATLSACDRAVGEVGRRSHLFGWLRDPSGGAESWLPVAAYYPGSRLVVVCAGSEHEEIYRQLVPEHGLRLLALDAEDPPTDAELRAMIAELPPVTRPTGGLSESGVARRESPLARALSEVTHPAPARAARARPSPPPEPGSGGSARSEPGWSGSARSEPGWGGSARSEPTPQQFIATGLIVGITMIAILCVEIYLAVVLLGAGHPVLAFGIAIDACARVLGTVGSERAGAHGWVWACVLGGSPVVARFALFQESGAVTVEPVPFAGLVAMLAICATLLGLLMLALGI